MGFELKSDRSIEGVSKAFKKVLTDRFYDMEKHLESAHTKLLDLADDVAVDPLFIWTIIIGTIFVTYYTNLVMNIWLFHLK